MFQKRTYIRSKPLLKAVAALDCQCCGAWPSQAAHSNWGGGKGRGIKADDNLIAALCFECHYEIDQGAKLNRNERKQKWLKAHKSTVHVLLESGQWPLDIPVPDTENLN